MTDEERLELFFFMLELIAEVNRLWDNELEPKPTRMH
jgi:hypothetical protein